MRFQGLISCCVLLATSIAYASVVKIDLNTGIIAPGNSMVISLAEFVPAHIYHLSCVLTSDHTSGKAYDLVQITTPTNSPTLVVNAEQTSPGSHQYNLPTRKNTYVTGDITKEIGDITITNLDNTDSIQVSSCHAVGQF